MTRDVEWVTLQRKLYTLLTLSRIVRFTYMVSQSPTPFAVPSLPGDLIRARRVAAGFSQVGLVAHLRALGVTVSYSHYCNMEKGRDPFQPQHLEALHALLGLDDVVAPGYSADRPRLPALRHWRDVADSLVGDDIANDDLAGASSSPVVAGTGPRSDAIHGFAAITSFVRSTLSGVSRAQAGDPGLVLIAGLPAIFRPKSELTRGVVRGLLHDLARSLNRAGLLCAHIVNDPESVWEVARVLGGMFGCPLYDIVVSPERRGLPADVLLVDAPSPGAPNGTLIQFVDDGHDITALVVRDATAIRSFRSALIRDTIGARPLIHRMFVEHLPTAVKMPRGQVAFYRQVTARAEHGVWRGFATGWLPNSLLPPELHARIILRRRAEAATFSDPDWEELIALQQRRHDALRQHLARGLGVTILIEQAALERFVADGSHIKPQSGTGIPGWRVFDHHDRTAFLETIVSLLEVHDALRIVVADADAHNVRRQLQRMQVEIRTGSDGCVVLKTPARHGASKAERAVMLIEHPLVTAGFRVWFGDLVGSVGPAGHDRERTIEFFSATVQACRQGKTLSPA